MASSPLEPLAEGVFLGGYRVVRRLAEGRFWDVYLARASTTRRVVALKILHDGLPEERVRRFLLKAKELAGLEHPHLARVFEAGRDSGRVFLAQEHVEGPRGRALSIADELRNHGGCLPEDTVRLRGRQLWEGLRAAHGFRDEGLGWGGAFLEDALLTPQHRVKLLAPGLRQILAGEEPGGPSGVVADTRGFGEFLHVALTGCPAGDEPPSASGAPRAWDRLVGACRGATVGALPDDRAIYDGLMTAGKPSHRGKWLMVAAAAVVLAAVIPAAMLLHTRSRPTIEEVAKAATEEAAARQDQQAATFLLAAETAMARMEFAKARAVVGRVLQKAPGNARATRLLRDIQAAEGLARVGATKNRAEEAWALVRDLPSGQGVGDKLTEAKLALDKARRGMEDGRFADAKTSFEKVAAIAEALHKADMARDSAETAQSRAMTARQAASAANAAEFATATWQGAVRLNDEGLAAFEKGGFPKAVALWQQAEGAFVEAERESEGRQAAESARDAYARQLQDVREAAIKAKPTALAEAEKKGQAAKLLLGKREWRRATEAWRDGSAILAKAYAEATEEKRQQTYAEALAQGRKLFQAGNYAGAESAFARALAEPGRGGDALAMQLYEKARTTRVARESGKAWRAADGNLVFNSDFEKGKDKAPAGWTKPDNLTVYWEKSGVKGMCIRMDTDVYRSEWEEHRKHPDTPMVKTPTTGTRYNTVGGTAGVAVYSRPIPVEPDGYYLVEFDVRGKGEPFMFIKGFWKCGPQDLHKMGKKMFFKPFKPGPSYSLMAMGTSGEEKRDAHPGDYIQCYRRRLVARISNREEWRHFRTVLHFEAARHIEVVLLELYAFWPPGDFYFDNVRMKLVTKAEADAHEAWRKKLGAEANFGTSVR
ncbi:MAG: hypothetical protein HN380_00030 [Victivallales bacterium]|nr:hypothetical protein [Victivallales bacterium]